jgi:hypothetical protein
MQLIRPCLLAVVALIQMIWKRSTVAGLAVLEAEVGNPTNPETTEKIEFLIDSGAIYSVVPTPVLERLGVRPLADAGVPPRQWV